MDDDRGAGTPRAHAKQDWISWLLSRIAYRAALAPGRTLCVAIFLTVVAACFAVAKLEFRTSRLDLLSDSAGYNQRWLSYLGRFGHDDDAVIVVSHSDPARVSQVLTAVGQRLESDPRLSGVLYRKSVGAVADKALHLMPARELEQLDQLLQACLGMLQATQSADAAGNVQLASARLAPRDTHSVPAAAGLAAADLAPADAAVGLSSGSLADSGLIASAEAALGAAAAMNQQLISAIAQAQSGLDQLQLTVPKEGPLLLEDEGRLGVCLVRLPHVDDKPREAGELLACLQAHLQTFRSEHAGVDVWLTGMPVLEWDESQSSQRDMQSATLLSLLGVAVIIVFGFGSWRMPCVAVLCLTMGLVWTVGLATLFIGHLNLFSVAFGAIIAGLGIDYAIHLLSRLSADASGLEPQQQDLPQALAEAVGHCGKGILTGSVTTAAAFAVAMLTPFRGMTELGTICALGTLSCMVATIWILPALLVWQSQLRLPAFVGRKGHRVSAGAAAAMAGSSRQTDRLGRFRTFADRGLVRLNGLVMRQRLSVVVCVGAVTVLATMQAGRLRYDHNLLNLQADGLPSVHAELELTRRSGQSAWFAISLAHSPQQARALHERLSNLPTVARVEEIGSVIASATAHPYKSELVAACRAHAEELVQQLGSLPAQAFAAAPGQQGLVRTASHLPAASAESPWASNPIVIPLQQLATSVQQMAAAASPTLEDFPAPVRERMASQDGETFLLRIFARENLWQRENLGQFVKELESVDPRVTGHPIQTWYASGELENSYYQAGIYAFLAVAALLMIDLGSIRLVMLAMVPACLSLLQLCGLLVWMDISFNAANMIVLPLILGIGIDDGVHIIHEYNARGNRTFTLSSKTALAILLTSLTTMVGFGSMGVADHRGLQSLGIVLLVGVGLCLLNSWLTLPAVLGYFGPQDMDLEEAGPREARTALRNELSKAPPAQPPVMTVARSEPPPAASLLLRDVPIVMSLPDYPDIRC